MGVSMRELAPWFRPYALSLVEVARQYGLKPRVTSTFRSISEQRRLYEEYQSGRSKYPAAPPGRSQHNYGLAFDMIAEDLNWLGAVWKHWGGYWSSTDPIHFGAPL